MSYTELKIVELDGSIKTYQEFNNSWGGFAYIWDSIWEKYVKKDESDMWLTDIERLVQAVYNADIPNWARLILVSTLDNAIVEYDKLPIMSRYYSNFIDLFPHGEKVCHLPEWGKACLKIHKDYNSANCAGICFYASSVCEDPWEDYDITKEDRHWFVFKKYAESLGLL